MKFKDTIGVFENAFTQEECQRIIDRQEYAIKNNLTNEGGYGNLANHKKSKDYDIS
jgi:hypothetical protein